MTPLRLFNSLTRAIEDFRPIAPPAVKVYSCGPTVYNFAHLGNLRAYVFTDTLRRALEWKGYAVEHVVNITDVGHLTSDADAGEDKMERAAATAGKTIWEIAAFYTAAFKSDLKALNIHDPTRWSVATDHIGDMIDFTKRIGKHTYQLETGLYFDTASVPDYGRLAGQAADETIGRIAEVGGKRHPADFAVWRASPPGERRQMEWDSPWGKGAPGWHLECSVMSMKYLGPQFDIHTGGIDHREIHHPNEIAQNQAYNCSERSGANVWMHNNFLVDRTGKMAKSAGAFLILRTLVEKGVHPLAYRLMCLQVHYRSEMEFTWRGLAAALTRLKRLVQSVEKLGGSEAGVVADPRLLDMMERFDAALADDLNTPRALTHLDAVLAAEADPAERRAAAARMDAALGLNLMRLTRADLRLRPAGLAVTDGQIASRLAERAEAKRARDFATADAIRAALDAAGVEIMDGDPLGWEWRVDLD